MFWSLSNKCQGSRDPHRPIRRQYWSRGHGNPRAFYWLMRDLRKVISPLVDSTVHSRSRCKYNWTTVYILCWIEIVLYYGRERERVTYSALRGRFCHQIRLMRHVTSNYWHVHLMARARWTSCIVTLKPRDQTWSREPDRQVRRSGEFECFLIEDGIIRGGWALV